MIEQGSGMIIDAPAFVREHALMAPEEITMPFREGEIYDPYEEAYWKRLASGRRS